MYIVGASVLVKDKESLPYTALRWETVNYKNQIFALGGLSFNHKRNFKNFVHLLTKGSLSRRSDMVLWHDAINISV